MDKREYTKFDSPIGELHIVSQNEKLVAIYLNEEDFLKKEATLKGENPQSQHPILKRVIQQLEEYFLGKRLEFDVPIEYDGTDFQMSVWNVLRAIPYGQTRSYQDVAHSINNIKAVRAVGLANKANKLPIVIPCHRVIGKNQSLTGYAGNKIDIKEKLLEIEGVTL
ncbi:methylated-DNA--[protein]-cysteine S-methyltransferase [Cytobacillus sp. FJAT-54145]|uniref:Methylated-DNA--protein-cysteine methyltransferase n=1 Tax=Cytobacillus spartinae TaxID=3299023 RepID=A0ABW6KH64_9BACI